MIHALLHVLGIDDVSGRWYAFWSGMGGDIGQFAIVGALVAAYRRHTCHVDHPRFCWRPGTHPVVDTPYRTCKRHHPDVPAKISAEHIATSHQDAQGGEAP